MGGYQLARAMALRRGHTLSALLRSDTTVLNQIYADALMYGKPTGQPVTVSGNPLMMPNCVKRQSLNTLGIGGWTSQPKTTGVNLLDISTVSPVGAYGLKTEIDGDAFHIFGTANTANSGLSFVFCILPTSDLSGKNYVITPFNASGTKIQSMWGLRTETEKSIALMIDTSVSQAVDMTFRLMVSVSKPTAYEPYTGGAASPSLDYPQPILHCESPTATMMGKNLLSVSEITTNGFYNVILPYVVDKPTVMTLSFTGAGNSDTSVQASVYCWSKTAYLNSGIRFRVTSDKQRYSATATIPAGTAQLLFYQNDFSSKLAECTDMQLELGSVATEYEPYQPPQQITLDGVELTKWDKIVKRDGIWGVSCWHIKKQLAVADMNNSENYPGWVNQKWLLNVVNPNHNGPISQSYNTHYSSINANTNVGATQLFCGFGGKTQSEIKNNYPDTVIDFVFGTLSEQSFIPLPDNAQAQLNALRTNTPTTIITADGDCTLQATYLCNLDAAETQLSELYNNDLTEVLNYDV